MKNDLSAWGWSFTQIDIDLCWKILKFVWREPGRWEVCTDISNFGVSSKRHLSLKSLLEQPERILYMRESQLPVKRPGKVYVLRVLMKWLEALKNIRILTQARCRNHFYSPEFQHRELAHNIKISFNLILTNNIN